MHAWRVLEGGNMDAKRTFWVQYKVEKKKKKPRKRKKKKKTKKNMKNFDQSRLLFV